MYSLVVPSKIAGGSEVESRAGGRTSCTPVAIFSADALVLDRAALERRVGDMCEQLEEGMWSERGKMRGNWNGDGLHVVERERREKKSGEDVRGDEDEEEKAVVLLVEL